MTVTIQTEELEQHQVLLSIDVAEERIQTAFQQKIKTLAREAQIPGFRPGKAPASYIVKRFGADTIRSEVVDELLPAILQEAMEQSELDVYDVVRMEDFVLQPTSFKVVVALTPTVNLGDYRAIRREMPAVEVSEEAVAEQLEHLRTHHEVLEPVDRPAELGDVVVVAGKGWLTPTSADEAAAEVAAEATEETAVNEPPEEVAANERGYIFDEKEAKLLLDPEKTFPHTPFTEKLAGVSTGDKVEFQFAFADDYDDEQLRGREAHFSLEILDVNWRELPELDDELAELEGEFETLEELRASIRENLVAAAQSEAESALFDDFVEELLTTAQINYPPLMVVQEAEGFKDGIKKELETLKVSWAKYLEMVEEDEATLEARWLTEAETRVRRHLVLRELINNEKLTVDQNDLMELLQAQLARYQDPEIRNYILSMYLEGNRGRDLRNEALAKKTQERVMAILTGQAPDLDALDEEEE